MLELIGAVLPHAVGIAVVPIPVIAVTLILMSPRARPAGLAFVLGWVVGLTIAVGLAAYAVHLSAGSEADSSPRAFLRLGLGVLLLVLAVRKFREPSDGENLPGWMTAVDVMELPKVVLLAAGLAALNPKNLTLVVAAADAASQTSTTVGSDAGSVGVVVALVFVLVASLSVAGPVVAYLIAPRRMAAPLESLKKWLLVHNASVMGTLLLVFAVLLIGQGLASV